MDLYEERVPYYEKYAQIVIEEDGLDVEGTDVYKRQVQSRIKNRGIAK